MAATAGFLPSELHQHRKEKSSPSLGSLEAQQATFPIPVPHHPTIPPSLGMSCALYQEHRPVHPSGICHLRRALLDDSGYREALPQTLRTPTSSDLHRDARTSQRVSCGGILITQADWMLAEDTNSLVSSPLSLPYPTPSTGLCTQWVLRNEPRHQSVRAARGHPLNRGRALHARTFMRSSEE